VYNTVAEIKGSENPDEVVIIGGHLDSWDLGTGATDNGTGSMAVLAAARALVKSGAKPKRDDSLCALHRRRARAERIESVCRGAQRGVKQNIRRAGA